MRTLTASIAVLSILSIYGYECTYATAQQSAGQLEAETDSVQELNTVVRTYCQGCHNDRMLTGNFSLDGFDFEAVANDVEATKKSE